MGHSRPLGQDLRGVLVHLGGIDGDYPRVVSSVEYGLTPSRPGIGSEVGCIESQLVIVEDNVTEPGSLKRESSVLLHDHPEVIFIGGRLFPRTQLPPYLRIIAAVSSLQRGDNA